MSNNFNLNPNPNLVQDNYQSLNQPKVDVIVLHPPNDETNSLQDNKISTAYSLNASTSPAIPHNTQTLVPINKSSNTKHCKGSPCSLNTCKFIGTTIAMGTYGALESAGIINQPEYLLAAYYSVVGTAIALRFFTCYLKGDHKLTMMCYTASDMLINISFGCMLPGFGELFPITEPMLEHTTPHDLKGAITKTIALIGTHFFTNILYSKHAARKRSLEDQPKQQQRVNERWDTVYAYKQICVCMKYAETLSKYLCCWKITSKACGYPQEYKEAML